MPTNPKRSILGRGKGYLNVAGPQSRFIIFLIFVLIGYTLLLQVFQKLAAILQLPLFFSISLLTLLAFIGVVGTVYSHSFVGPMSRIRKAVDLLASGDVSVSLRLRESDDPMLKELADSIGRLCQHARNAQTLINSSAQDLSADIAALQEAVRTGADRAELQKHIDGIRTRYDVLQKAVQTLGRS
jgi:methyl-accepting chemotaxis protein